MQIEVTITASDATEFRQALQTLLGGLGTTVVAAPDPRMDVPTFLAERASPKSPVTGVPDEPEDATDVADPADTEDDDAALEAAWAKRRATEGTLAEAKALGADFAAKGRTIDEAPSGITGKAPILAAFTAGYHEHMASVTEPDDVSTDYTLADLRELGAKYLQRHGGDSAKLRALLEGVCGARSLSQVDASHYSAVARRINAEMSA